MTAEDTTKLGSMLHTWDYMSADHQRLKWEIFGYARGQCPVARTEEGGGFWLVTRYDDVKRVLRDLSRFRDADTLVFDNPRGGHAAFGLGVHRCVGSNLARLQIEIAFDELLKQVRNLRLTQARRLPGCRATATSCTP